MNASDSLLLLKYHPTTYVSSTNLFFSRWAIFPHLSRLSFAPAPTAIYFRTSFFSQQYCSSAPMIFRNYPTYLQKHRNCLPSLIRFLFPSNWSVLRITFCVLPCLAFSACNPNRYYSPLLRDWKNRICRFCLRNRILLGSLRYHWSVISLFHRLVCFLWILWVRYLAYGVLLYRLYRNMVQKVQRILCWNCYPRSILVV